MLPRISVNKLAEYMIASPSRRRRIISDQKHPKNFIAPRYRLADEPLELFFGSGGIDAAALLDGAACLRSDKSGTPWAISDRQSTADALDAIRGLAGNLPFDGITYKLVRWTCPLLPISKVNVSIAPHFLLEFEQRGVPHVGAVKLHFPKEAALLKEGSEYVAVLLYQWLLQHGPKGRRPSLAHCFSVDVFRQSVVHAPAAHTRRMKDVAAACEEYAGRWTQL